MNKTRYSMLVVAIFLALTLSALNVVPAFADESTPPEPAPTEEVTEVAEPVEGEEEATPPAPEETDSAVGSDSPSVAEVIESLPEDTTLVVVDETGEALPLASEEAAAIIKVADPQWCPVGVKPGGAGCSGVKDSFNGLDANFDLIQWLKENQPNKAGVIWIAYNYVGTSLVEVEPVVLDGLDYATMDNFALTINGGWNGLTGSTVMNPNTPSTFNVPFNIINWTGAITINNIVIEGASGNQPNLFVQTSGNIVLNNVDVQNNTTDYGASLNNTSGTGTVTVNDGTFNNNTGTEAVGLEIYSNNTVTLKNISAMGNTEHGLYIYNGSASTPKAVTLNGTNHFNYNGWDGLHIITKGAITLNNITAMGNTGGSGANLSNGYSSTVPSAVTIKGTNNFSDNGWDGLRVYTYGAIAISNITANDNGTDPNRDAATDYGGGNYDSDAYGKGVYLYNTNWVLGGKPQPITLTGTNTFNGNASNGLYLNSNGVVKINNLTANHNGCDPLKDLDDYGCAGAYITGAGVTLTGYNFFIGNSNQGLEVYDEWVPAKNSYVGAITLSNLYAVGNGEGGVWAQNNGSGANVTITGTNVFNENQLGDGLTIISGGVITLSNLTANDNEYGGVYVDNTDTISSKAVKISGVNTFNGNGVAGLTVYSYGAITTNNVTANFNGWSGVWLDNCRWDEFDDNGKDGDEDCLAPAIQPVTMNGVNVTSENGGDGVHNESRGAITVNNITSNYNGTVGLALWNSYSNSVGAITQKGYANLSNNYGFSGLNAYSNGAITLTNLTANGNNTFGVVVWNNNYVNPAKPANVTITGSNTLNDNGKGGLWIESYGAVLLNNLTTNRNGLGYWVWDDILEDMVFIDTESYYGVSIDNSGGAKSMPVTINGTNTFNGNNGTGLVIYSLGAIKVNNTFASGNEFEGAYLDNQYNLFSAPITITGYGIFNDNDTDGLVLSSNGNIVVSNITANYNTDYGVNIFAINDLKPTSVANVTITGVNTFNGNTGGHGLYITTDGAITLSNITANSNGLGGAYLDNDTNANSGPNSGSSGIQKVTVSGVNMFNNNFGTGLTVLTKGIVNLTRITANLNAGGGSGLIVETINAITLTCGSFYSNASYGYNLDTLSTKVITLKGVFTFGNPSGNTTHTTLNPSITRNCPLP